MSEHHKNILKYVDSSIQRQTDEIYEILLLTKYCKLGGLVQLINERLGSGGSSAHLQENEIVKIFCDVCEAVAALHENAIIHRDLKTENILIDTSDTDKKQPRSAAVNPNTINYVLCDFGSATTQIFDRRLNSSVQSVQLVADEIQKYFFYFIINTFLEMKLKKIFLTKVHYTVVSFARNGRSLFKQTYNDQIGHLGTWLSPVQHLLLSDAVWRKSAGNTRRPIHLTRRQGKLFFQKLEFIDK